MIILFSINDLSETIKNFFNIPVPTNILGATTIGGLIFTLAIIVFKSQALTKAKNQIKFSRIAERQMAYEAETSEKLNALTKRLEMLESKSAKAYALSPNAKVRNIASEISKASSVLSEVKKTLPDISALSQTASESKKAIKAKIKAEKKAAKKSIIKAKEKANVSEEKIKQVLPVDF